MLSEQTLLNAAVLTVAATSPDKALAGIVFDVLLIARAPLQLFQAIQTSLLPHLTGLEATAGHAAFARAIRVTVLAIAAFAAAVALGLLAIGPFVMGHLFGQHYSYGRVGLALSGSAWACTWSPARSTRPRSRATGARGRGRCWLLAAVAFLAWMLTPGGRRPAAAHRDRLRRRHRRCWRSLLCGALPPGLARRSRRDAALSPRPTAPRDRPVGLAGIGRAEDRRAGDEHARARLRGSAGAVSGSMPPSTSTADAVADDRARRAASLSSECSMNGCPPQPGVDGHAQRQVDRVARPRRARRRGVAGVDRHARRTRRCSRIRSAA